MKTPERFEVRLSKEERAKFHKALVDLKGSGPERMRWGICDNTELPEDVIGYLSKDWSKFSGDTRYPVPSGKKDVTPCFAYASSNNLWDKRTKYGRLRWELLDFLIEQTKPEA